MVPTPGSPPDRTHFNRTKTNEYPQGGLASQILWLAYINDLLDTISKKYGIKNTFSYPDDLLIIVKSHDEGHRLVKDARDWAYS